MLASGFPIISRAELVSRKQEPPRIESRIDLHKGHPNGSLIPIDSLLESAHEVLTDKTINIPALQYGPDPGWQPLRESLSKWLTIYYEQESDDVERICITGGASQNLACILQTFTDPNITKRIWTVGPVYHLACPIFEDAGFAGRLRACVEDEEGIELVRLEKEIRKIHGEEPRGPVSCYFPIIDLLRFLPRGNVALYFDGTAAQNGSMILFCLSLLLWLVVSACCFHELCRVTLVLISSTRSIGGTV